MSAREISRKHARSEDDDCINKELEDVIVIDIENDNANNGNLDKRTKSVFNELLNKEKSSDLLKIQDKNKGVQKFAVEYIFGIIE
jgi:hypothetical protein